MSTPNDTRTQYHATFDIHSKVETPIWSDVVEIIQSWIQRKEKIEYSFGKKLFCGGGLNFEETKSFVKVLRELGEGSEKIPQYWALRYDERDKEISSRRWRTDIGITVLEDTSLRFAIRVIYYLLPGFIGEEPDAPDPTSPMIVKDILGCQRWSASAGSECVCAIPRTLVVGDMPLWKKRLECQDRNIPLIAISAKRGTENDVLVDQYKLSRELAGAATIYIVSATFDAVEEQNYFIPPHYRCNDGMVRIYMPKVQLGDERDFKRHRYFSAQVIEDKGPDVVQSLIIRGLSRRYQFRQANEVFDIDDVFQRTHEVSLKKLRSKLSGSNDIDFMREWTKELETDNKRLETNNAEFEKQLKEREYQIDSLQGDLDQSEYQRSKLTRQMDQLRRQLYDRECTIRVVDSLNNFPRDMIQVLKFVENLYPSKIAVHENALKSAKDAKFRNIDEAWQALRAIALHLHSLYFEESGINIENQFKSRSGFEVSLTEGKLTKQNKAATNERQINYNDEIVDITPHLKIGVKDTNLLRIHYYVDRENKVLVIGHCGNHLATYGTGRKGLH